MIFQSLDEIEALLAAQDWQGVAALRSTQTQKVKPLTFCAPLMVSGHQLKHLNKIDELPTDVIMFNLEDGVAPEKKEAALHLVALFATHAHALDKHVVVRINPLEESGFEEIALLNSVHPDAIRIPKIEQNTPIERVPTLLHAGIDIHLSIETAWSWNHMAQLAAIPRVTTFYLGVLDFFAQLGLDIEGVRIDNPLMHYLLSHFLITCKSHAIRPVSFVYQEYKNLEALQAWLALEKSLGYRAKGAISPQQAQHIIQAFALDTEKLKKARYIVEKFEAMQAQGITGFKDEHYDFIDEPIYKASLALLRG
ncbi:MAG: hypothetical protein KU37_10265 [Sulfuricurvum sp. PC08-66]|nr:MAG: hypothetical protein KU37_10265 [Sulfuricurvum sp. PC08-66]